MGYLSYLTGQFTISPPLDHTQCELFRTTYQFDEDWRLLGLKTDHTPHGTIGGAIIVEFGEDVKAYEFERECESLAMWFRKHAPDVTVSGFVKVEGEENTDIWRMVWYDRNHVRRENAVHSWPDGTTLT